LNKGIKRQFSTTIEKDYDLKVIVSTTGDVNMYLRLGEGVQVNSAIHDAAILVEKVWIKFSNF